MASPVSREQICNLALAHIHETQNKLVNFDTDLGTIPDNCRIHYDPARRFVLADALWNFATTRLVLTDIGNPPTGWAYRYQYPSDCLRFQEIQRDVRQSTPIQYKVEYDRSNSAVSILTDLEAATGVYTWDVENPALFTPGFVKALGYYLASELAFAVAADDDLQKSRFQIYRAHYGPARAQDSNEEQDDGELDSPWERARQGGSS